MIKVQNSIIIIIIIIIMTIILLKKKQTNKNWREPLELRKRARDPIQDAFPYTCPKYNKNAKQKSAVWQII